MIFHQIEEKIGEKGIAFIERHQNHIPVNLEFIANDFHVNFNNKNIPVKISYLSDFDMKGASCGYLVENNVFNIMVNKSMSIYRIRYGIAFIIGFILMCNIKNRERYFHNFNSYGVCEVEEANFFVMMLLVPKHVLTEHYLNLNLEKLSRLFCVTKSLVSKALVNYKLISF